MSTLSGVVVKNGFLLVSPDPIPDKVGDIVLPEQNALRPLSGVVALPSISCAADYPEGKRVVYGRYSGESISIDMEAYKLLHETEIQCVIDPETGVSS